MRRAPSTALARRTWWSASDGQLIYKGTAYETTSVCIDKADGGQGKVMYFESGAGHFDVSDRADATAGQAWGVSPLDGATVFTRRPPVTARRRTQSLRRACTASLSTCSTASESSQPMQASVMLWP